MHNLEKPKRIHLVGAGRNEETVAAEIIKPGALIALDADGKVVNHATAGGWAEKNFALEDALQGRTINDDYAVDSIVFSVIAAPGDVIYAWLAAGEDADPSKALTSNGDGTLKVAATTDIRLAVPLETLDLSDSSSAVSRIRVRVL